MTEAAVKETEVAVKMDAEVETTEAEVEGIEAEVEKTEAEVEKTEAVVKTTVAAVKTTEAAVKKTNAAVKKTEALVKKTEAVVKKTEAPVKKTEAAATKTPVKKTEAAATKTPVKKTEAVASKTEAPVRTTEAAASKTEAPATKTEAAASMTEAAASKTEAPASKTEAPATKTAAPVKKDDKAYFNPEADILIKEFNSMQVEYENTYALILSHENNITPSLMDNEEVVAEVARKYELLKGMKRDFDDFINDFYYMAFHARICYDMSSPADLAYRKMLEVQEDMGRAMVLSDILISEHDKRKKLKVLLEAEEKRLRTTKYLCMSVGTVAAISFFIIFKRLNLTGRH